MNALVDTDTRDIFQIPEMNFTKFSQQVAKLSRRAEKLIGKKISPQILSSEYVDAAKGPGKIKMLQVFFDCEVPRIDGWTFVARLDHSQETGNIIRSVPNTGVVIPVKYRDVAPNCDHCNMKRKRRDTFLVCEDATGNFKQVGATCLIDFFGHDPQHIARLAELLGYAVEAAHGAGSMSGPLTDHRYIDLEDFLAHAAKAIREYGWVSKAMVRDSADPLLESTAARASTTFFHTEFPENLTTDEDVETAQKALEWVRGFCHNDDLNDYMHNLCVIAGSEVIEFRATGLAASMIFAYKRESEKTLVRKATEIGDMAGIMAMFDKAVATGMKRVAFVLSVPNTTDGYSEIKISLAGASSQNVGCLYVKNNDNGLYLGKITPEGKFLSPGRAELPKNLEPTLLEFAANPAEVAARHGKLTGRCTFCDRPLDDARSTVMGYGPVCAKRWSLPWGTDPESPKPRRARKAKAADASTGDTSLLPGSPLVVIEAAVASMAPQHSEFDDQAPDATEDNNEEPIMVQTTAIAPEQRILLSILADQFEAGQDIYGLETHPWVKHLIIFGYAATDNTRDAVPAARTWITAKGLRLLGRGQLSDHATTMLGVIATTKVPGVWQSVPYATELVEFGFAEITEDKGVETLAITQAGIDYATKHRL